MPFKLSNSTIFYFNWPQAEFIQALDNNTLINSILRTVLSYFERTEIKINLNESSPLIHKNMNDRTDWLFFYDNVVISVSENLNARGDFRNHHQRSR